MIHFPRLVFDKLHWKGDQKSLFTSMKVKVLFFFYAVVPPLNVFYYLE